MRPASSIALLPLWLFFLPFSEPAALPNSSRALRRFSCTFASVARREADLPTPSSLASCTSGPYSFRAAESASLRSSRNSLSYSARSRYGFSVSTVGATLRLLLAISAPFLASSVDSSMTNVRRYLEWCHRMASPKRILLALVAVISGFLYLSVVAVPLEKRDKRRKDAARRR